MRYVIAFGRFWYDFLIGDRPELFIGTLIALAAAALAANAGWGAASGLLLFALVVASLGWGLVAEVKEARIPREAELPG
jgi:ABC-type spermidine/putrescine transport system permease subunit I